MAAVEINGRSRGKLDLNLLSLSVHGLHLIFIVTDFSLYKLSVQFRLVNGTTYLGLADEKEKVSEEFERRKKSGENVGLVESR